MIKRTHKSHILQVLRDNNTWEILDLGCGRFAWEEAQTLSDMVDHTDLYPEKRFVQSDAANTPFDDKRFDFVIASHIAEHMHDLDKFLTELSRIAKRGYIEVPLPLFDNFTYGNREEHVWWMNFDDVNMKLIAEPKAIAIQARIMPAELPMLEEFFRPSMALELYWEDNIEWSIRERRIHDIMDLWPEPHSNYHKPEGSHSK
jgi:SAM-dependent methyltransferase